ncbi:hypothetical protein GCM10023081_32680 [Arthrobacter ginkgonis]|uniref:Uncharacterized protein n=1 Tax=Arthrobacter ginkgonis TaxID=1630594 RepID=A0ABP7CPR7_9MICC
MTAPHFMMHHCQAGTGPSGLTGESALTDRFQPDFPHRRTSLNDPFDATAAHTVIAYARSRAVPGSQLALSPAAHAELLTNHTQLAALAEAVRAHLHAWPAAAALACPGLTVSACHQA